MPRLIFFRLTSVNVFRFPYLLVFAFVFPFVFYLVFSVMFLFAFPLVFLFLRNTVSTLCLPTRISSRVRQWIQVVLRSALYVCLPLTSFMLALDFQPVSSLLRPSPPRLHCVLFVYSRFLVAFPSRPFGGEFKLCDLVHSVSVICYLFHPFPGLSTREFPSVCSTKIGSSSFSHVFSWYVLYSVYPLLSQEHFLHH